MIVMYDLEDNYIREFSSYKECAIYFNTSVRVIHSHICRRKKGTVDKKKYKDGWCRLFKMEEDNENKR